MLRLGDWATRGHRGRLLKVIWLSGPDGASRRRIRVLRINAQGVPRIQEMWEDTVIRLLHAPFLSTNPVPLLKLKDRAQRVQWENLQTIIR